MQKVLTAAQMREVDRLTTERYGIPSIILMENAAHAVARVITEKLGGSITGKKALILVGKGSNGGDGLAIARVLWTQGADVTICLMFPDNEVTGDAAQNLGTIRKLHGGQTAPYSPIICIAEVGTHREFFDRMDPYFGPDVIVDALFGTGLTRPLNEEHSILAKQYQSVFEHTTRPVFVSVDLPSGLNADRGERIGEAFRADVTVTFTRPKPANVLPPTATYGGELLTANIGAPSVLIKEQRTQFFLAQPSDASEWLKKSEFANSSYKNKRGHALLIAGSKNYTGAAVLAADAAMRSGVGLVTLAVPESSRESVVARVMPEVMVRGISETAEGSASEKAVDEIKEFLKNVDAIALGSGLSTNEKTTAFVRRMVEERTMPMVIDADGLTALSPFDMQGSDDFPMILTPHEGEFMRLLGTEDKEVIKDRVAVVRDFATKHGVILVLKGERVLIGEPGGKVVVNPTGNSGLGKAGNGDTLTGILIGFVAQAMQMKIDIFETVVAACYVAGMAGDVAEKKYGKRVMTASDVRECLTEVFDSLEAN